jgi:hypothetical protein
MVVEKEQGSRVGETVSAGEKKLAQGGAIAVSVATDVLSVADHAGGMLVGGAAGLISGMIQGLGEGFDIGRAKGGLLGGVVGLPVAAVSQGLQGLTAGMSKGLETGVTHLVGTTKAP